MRIVRLHHPALDSTSSWALQNLGLFDREALTVVTCDDQTAGRGTNGRSWYAPPGKNLTASFVIFTLVGQQRFGYAQLAMLAVRKTLAECGVTSQIKWPNDLLVEGHKIAGVLVETKEMDGRMALVIGVGLNVNMALPEGAKRPPLIQNAISIREVLGHDVSLTAVTDALISHIHHDLERLPDAGFLGIARMWERDVAWMVGKAVRIEALAMCGTIERIDENGYLLLRTADGLREFRSGEVSVKPLDSTHQPH